MKRTIQVFIGDEACLAGTLHYDLNGTRERAAFTYDEAWLAAKEALPWSPAYPWSPEHNSTGRYPTARSSLWRLLIRNQMAGAGG
jgi:HipA N-terminal domain